MFTIGKGVVLSITLLLPCLWAGSATAADEVTERAVPGPSTPLRQMAPAPGRAIPAMTVEQQLTALQQQVQSLQAQLAALQSVLKVTPTGATLQAPTVSILTSGDTMIQSGKGVTVRAATGIAVQSQADTSIKAGSTATLESSGTTQVKGAILKLNGGSKPMATVGSAVGNGQIVSGSTTILGN